MHIIYIPGLGFASRIFIPEYFDVFHVQWTRSQKVFQVLDRLKGHIKDDTIIIGTSAGASLAVLAAQKYPKIKRVYTICGPLRPVKNPFLMAACRLSPLLHDTLQLSAKVRLKQEATVMRSVLDEVVSARSSAMQGAREVVIPVPGHVPAILYGLFRVPNFLYP